MADCGCAESEGKDFIYNSYTTTFITSQLWLCGCDTRNEVDDRETDLLDDETILMRVEEIEAVYASKDLGMSEVDGTACEVEKKVDITEDAEDCEWDDEKDEDGGAGGERGGGRTNKTNGGVRGEVASKMPGESSDPSSSKGSGSAANKESTASIVCCTTAKSTSTLKDYIDDGRDYIVSSRSVVEDIDEESNYSGDKSSYRVPDTTNHLVPSQEEDPCVDISFQSLVLVTPPKRFNKNHRKVDDNDDFLNPVPICVSSGPTHEIPVRENEDNDFVDPVPQCVSSRPTHEIPAREDEDEDFVEPVPQCVSSRHTQGDHGNENQEERCGKETSNDESLMKAVRVVELYGFEDWCTGVPVVYS
ncbi:hypothetical protein Bca101_019993 [Brassica carinata]